MIGIISICSKEYSPLLVLTSKVNYARKHGYKVFTNERDVVQKTAGYDECASPWK